MPTNIIDYKQTILDMFHDLTEIEMDIVKGIMKRDPEKNSDIGTTYLMGVSRCRQILETILRDKIDERNNETTK